MGETIPRPVQITDLPPQTEVVQPVPQNLAGDSAPLPDQASPAIDIQSSEAATGQAGLANLNARLRLMGRGVRDGARRVVESEGFQQTARFAVYLGKEALMGAIEGTDLTTTRTGGTAGARLDRDKIRSTAKAGAISAASRALRESVKKV